jgi:WD40 repeat protein
LTGHSFRVWSVAFSPDGSTLASSAGEFANELEPGEIKLWDLKTNKEALRLTDHSSVVFCVSFSHDGKHIVSTSRDKTARLWDVKTGKSVHTLTGHGDVVRFAAFAPGDKSVATCSFDGTVMIWDVETGKASKTIRPGGDIINCLAFSPDGKTLALASNKASSPITSDQMQGDVRLWNLEENKERVVLRGGQGWALAIAFSKDGKTLVSVGGQQTQFSQVAVWDAGTGRMIASLGGHREWVECVAFSPDGRSLVTGGGFTDAGGQVKIWAAPHNSRERLLTGHGAPVTCAAFTPDGKTLATGSEDRTVRLWDVETGDERAVLKGYANPIRCLAYSPDGKALAVACQKENTISLVNIAGRAVLKPANLDSADITSISFSPDGKRLAASGGADDQPNGSVRVWDLTTGKETGAIRSIENPQTYWSTVFSQNGKLLVTASGNDVKIYDTQTLEMRGLYSSVSPVRVLALSTDGKVLASGHSDGSVRLYDADTGRERSVLVGQTGAITALSFSSDGRMLVASMNGAPACVWQLSELKPAPEK